MVVGVFHLTYQIEITNGGSHNATILSAARWPALPPAGQLTPVAASHSNTSTSLGGYDVSRLSHAYPEFARISGEAYSLGFKQCANSPLTGVAPGEETKHPSNR